MGQSITVNNGNDVVTFLKNQHQQIKTLFAHVLATSGPARAQAFRELRRLLAVHETAEEEIVHPAAKQALPDGAAIVSARLSEENAAKKALTTLERLDVNSSEFVAEFTKLEEAVLAHATAEETEEFVRLADTFDAKQLVRMRKAVEFAEAVAPVRPHPGVESPAANLLAGPFAAMIDRARDALTPPKS